jgi:hypothetical protein
MRISNADRLQAIARNPHFIKMRDELIELLKTSTKDECVSKQDETINLFKLSLDEFMIVFKISLGKKIKAKEKNIFHDRPPVIPTSIRDLAILHILDLKTLTFPPEEILKADQKVLDERYLLVRIDLMANGKDIIRELKTCLEAERLSGKNKGRKRDTTVDPWRVYDMHHREKKNFLRITKKLFEIQKNPTYDPQAKSRYNQVERAYRKAERMIEIVIPPNLSK